MCTIASDPRLCRRSTSHKGVCALACARRVRDGHNAAFRPPDAVPNAVQWSRTAPPSNLHITSQPALRHRSNAAALPQLLVKGGVIRRPRAVGKSALPRGLAGRSSWCASEPPLIVTRRTSWLPSCRSREGGITSPRKGERTHWNLAHHLLAHHPWPYYRSNQRHSLRTRSPTRGPTRGIVSRRTRLTTRLKPVRAARKYGSTWARSFSRRLGARRFCISSGIVTTRERSASATSSSPRARRSNAGMVASSSARYGPAFLHCSHIPLEQVDLSTVAERGRRSLLETNAMPACAV
jgi:hypothetical protein